MPDSDQQQVVIRDELVRILMERVRADPYPSVDMLNTLERLLAPEELGEYAAMLLERVRRDKYPSWPMINRLHNLAGRQLYAGALAQQRR